MRLNSIKFLMLNLLLLPTAFAVVPTTTLNLMPVPAQMTHHDGKLRLTKDFSVALSGPRQPRLNQSSLRFLRRLDGRTGLFLNHEIGTVDNKSVPTLRIAASAYASVLFGSDESYSLEINGSQIQLTAPTDLGAMHGLETLLQLVMVDEQGYYFPQVSIHDQPRFPWRGLMIDVARHFLPVDVIKHNIDGMAAVKMNVLHLHLTDNQGFRIESKVYPRLHELANGEYFTQVEIKELVAYATMRGIRIVPEFDLPAHATAMLAAYPTLGSKPGPYQVERKFGIFDPVIDPTLEQNYQFLEKLFAELLPLFPDAYVHIGGDENAKGTDWNENPSIQKFMKLHHIADNHELQAYFSQRMQSMLIRMNRKMIGWEEILNPKLPKSAVVQIWLGKESLFKAAQAGYETILSEGYYIDLMHNAADHYLNDPIYPDQEKLSKAELARILGGEATMWSELVSAQNVDTRIWPRTAAIAERLWSPVEVRDVDDMYRRLDVTSIRLEELGLNHITSRQVIMRDLAGASTNTEALEVLLDVVEPMKEYTRNADDNLYSVDAPFSLFADAASSDAKAARLFNQTMNRFLVSASVEDREVLRSMLVRWRDNHAAILELVKISPVLAEVKELSANLKSISEIALTLLDAKLEVSDKRFSQIQLSLLAARNQGGRTELQVVTAIENLVKQRCVVTANVTP